MGGNISRFRDRITLAYVIGQTITSMGSNTPTFKSYTIPADVVQMKADQIISYGMDAMRVTYRIVTRPPVGGRPARVFIGVQELEGSTAIMDKIGQFIEIIAVEKV